MKEPTPAIVSESVPLRKGGKHTRRPPAVETPAQRDKRLSGQARDNGVRVKNAKDGTFLVPSQDPAAHPLPYTVRLLPKIDGLSCTCDWGRRNGAYTANHTPTALCAHIARVLAYLKRQHLTAATASYRAYRAEVDPAPPAQGARPWADMWEEGVA